MTRSVMGDECPGLAVPLKQTKGRKIIVSKREGRS
jgi:hypothetical protein